MYGVGVTYRTPRGLSDTCVHVYPVLVSTLHSTMERYMYDKRLFHFEPGNYKTGYVFHMVYFGYLATRMSYLYGNYVLYKLA
jgi:hypothetical protein